MSACKNTRIFCSHEEQQYYFRGASGVNDTPEKVSNSFNRAAVQSLFTVKSKIRNDHDVQLNKLYVIQAAVKYKTVTSILS